MLILVEGADGLGKTTLCKALQWKVHCAYVHNKAPAQWKLEDFFTVLPSAIYDRYHWSMWAYKEINKQPLDLSEDACGAIDARLRERLVGKYVTVCLYASDPDYFAQMPEDHLFDLKKVQSVNERYTSVLRNFDLIFDVSATGYPTAERVLDLIGF